MHKTKSVKLHGWKKWDENHSHPTLFSHPISTWMKTQGSHMCSKLPTLFIPAQIKPNYCNSNRTSFFYLGQKHLVFTCMLQCYVASTVSLVPTTSGGHWQHQWTDVWRCGVPLQLHNQLWQSLDEGCWKVRHRVLGCGVGVVREHSSVIQSKVYYTVQSTKQNPKLIRHQRILLLKNTQKSK